MDLLQAFKAHIEQHLFFKVDDLLILAVSGGVDSMVLASLCHTCGYRFVLAHCNFQLRGEESTRDQLFVEQYAKASGLSLYVKTFDTKAYKTENKLSTQEAARNLRYTWLKNLAEQLENAHNAKTYILTAHHADDQTETLMMNFFRGTGLNGLTGIPEKNERILRPLLTFTKKSILEFANQHRIESVEDSSNQSSDYTRNFFRNDIIPLIEKVYPAVRQNLAENITRFQETNLLYQIAIKPILKKIIHEKGNEYHISIKALFKYNNAALIYELIHPFGFTEGQIDSVKKLKHAKSGSYLVAPNTFFRCIKNRDHFVIAPPLQITSEIITIQAGEKSVKYSAGMITMEEQLYSGTPLSSSSGIAMLDAKNIRYPLILRKWKEGDYFYPLGMSKKKKIARFLIDQKLSATEKENIWILESDSRIIWLVGYRIDDRFKVCKSTEKILKIERRV
jgi:tRNA(Ile)-lysidine synthase